MAPAGSGNEPLVEQLVEAAVVAEAAEAAEAAGAAVMAEAAEAGAAEAGAAEAGAAEAVAAEAVAEVEVVQVKPIVAPEQARTGRPYGYHYKMVAAAKKDAQPPFGAASLVAEEEAALFVATH